MIDRQSLDASRACSVQGPVPTSRLGGETVDGERLPKW
jgi:hypothetical protein